MVRAMRNTLIMLVLALFATVASTADAKRITLKTKDGLQIAADYVAPTGAKRGVLVLLHEYKMHRFVWKPLYAHAAKEGLGVLALDLRGHGESKQQGKVDYEYKINSREEAVFTSMHLDVLAGMKWLKSKGIPSKKVVLVGASVGCSVALHYVAANPKTKVRAAVLMTPGKHYMAIPSMEHIKRWGTRPLLLVTSRDEADKGAK